MPSLPHSDSSAYWRFYALVGSLKPYPLRVLAHILTIYGPNHSAAEAQAALRKRAVAELQRREAQGNALARQVLRDYMGFYQGKEKPTTLATWEEQAGTDPNTGFTL